MISVLHDNEGYQGDDHEPPPPISSRATCLALLLALALAPKPVHATTFTVTRTDDPPPNGCAPSDCSLREAVIAANVNAGPDTITIPADTFTLGIPNVSGDEDAAATGDLDITGVLTITGAGANSTIIQAGTVLSNSVGRVFEISNSGVVTVSGLTVRFGKAEFGGGIENTGVASLSNAVIEFNQAEFDDGGGISNVGGILTLISSTVRFNGSVGGGGIYNANVSTLILTNSTINDNGSISSGGGIYNILSTATIINSTISGNAAGINGGGIFNEQATITLLSTTIARNAADNNANGTGDGGGIVSAAGQVTLKNSLIGDNTDKGGQAPDCSGTLTSQGYNLIENTTACIIAGDTTGNISGANPNIEPLQDNGGPTFTHALVRSRAVNAGDPAGCTDANGQLLTTDQRGVARPQGPRCDIGAFEREQTYKVFLPIVIR